MGLDCSHPFILFSKLTRSDPKGKYAVFGLAIPFPRALAAPARSREDLRLSMASAAITVSSSGIARARVTVTTLVPFGSALAEHVYGVDFKEGPAFLFKLTNMLICPGYPELGISKKSGRSSHGRGSGWTPTQ